jgi:kinetochore protein NDC80
VRTLIAFLAQAGYPHSVSPRTLQAPSAKDFQTIFRFLYLQLDPNYVYAKKFEEEVPAILKGLRYPFADQINRSHLQSVGSLHSWPSLLATLTWMVELILCCDQLSQGGEDEYDGVDGHAQKIFYNYLIKTYQVFLAGEDNFDALDEELSASFGM